MKNISTDELESNWKKYESILKKLEDDNISKLLERFGERIVICPSSRSESETGAYPGGLVENSLSVAGVMKKINDSLGMGVSMMSILKVSLLHDIGKIGDENEDMFLPQTSSWHQEKLGHVYMYNEKLPKMSISHRSLYLLQSSGISLTREEWLAIQIASGSHFEENRFYVRSEPTVAMLLQKAKSLVDHQSTHHE